MIKLLFSLSVLAVAATGQRIMTIQLDGTQYYISRMNPYSPELNYYLAYQYCRSLGLQLASFDSKEKYNGMVQYLKNANFGDFDYWTSGNRLGTGMFLWMSTGLPFNSTFDYFDHESPADSIDHNGNTSPQRTARDDSRRPLDKHCVLLKAPSLKWEANDCLQVKDFICEQTRCYYYNYGSIPVSASQGRKISANIVSPVSSTTSSTTASPLPSFKDTTALYFSLMGATSAPHSEDEEVEEEHSDEHSVDETSTVVTHEEGEAEEEEHHTVSSEEAAHGHTESSETTMDVRASGQHSGSNEEEEEVPVEQRLRELTDDLGRLQQLNTDDENRQSFLSLSDLIKSLRHEDEKPLQIDSSYSRSKVLGEKTDIVYHPRNTGDVANRSLFKK